MEIEIKVISKEIIKPSFSTPKSLQKYHLSFLDQTISPFFVPFIYLYSSNYEIPNSQKIKHLKKSLSETLSTYYPLAGRLNDNLYIDCNDGGIPFFEAKVNYNLAQLITNPNYQTLTKFLPNMLMEQESICMAVQATYFLCGGVAIGILVSHKIADGFSIVMFVNSWSAVTRKGEFGGLPTPKFDSATYFPPQNISNNKIKEISEVITAKYFTFPAAKIAQIQENYSCGDSRRRPSRVQALLVYICTHFLSATGLHFDPNKICMVHQPVNLRTKVDDLLSSEYHFGNFLGSSMTTLAAGDGAYELLQKVKQANLAVYDNDIDQLMEAFKKDLNLLLLNDKNYIFCCFSSICGFSLYEADFGWGKPIWVTPLMPLLKNVTYLMDTRSGGGIDALIMLSKQDMEKFEADFMVELLLKSNL